MERKKVTFTVMVTREYLEKFIAQQRVYIEITKMLPLPPKRMNEILDGATYQLEAKCNLLETMKKENGHTFIYRLDGNYNLIRRILI